MSSIFIIPTWRYEFRWNYLLVATAILHPSLSSSTNCLINGIKYEIREDKDSWQEYVEECLQERVRFVGGTK